MPLKMTEQGGWEVWRFGWAVVENIDVIQLQNEYLVTRLNWYLGINRNLEAKNY
jgi:hypothetical protein